MGTDASPQAGASFFMLNAIIGLKQKQTQAFTADGKRIAVTKILTEPCCIVDIKTVEKDGYSALCLGLGVRRIKTVRGPQIGLFKKTGLDNNPPRFLKEVKITPEDLQTQENLKPGVKLDVSQIFHPGDTVEVQGVSKGKGFQGGVKRHHFKGGPRTHGQSDRERAPGAIGQTTTPGRVYRGKRMAGRMGNTTTTVKNLKVISVDQEKQVITVSGMVPGGQNNLLTIKKQS